MTDKQIYEGGCLCGAIRYQSRAAPSRGVICHCSMCRKHSGAPILAFVHFPKASFSWLNANPSRYRSSQFAERGFCSTCGSTISMHEEVLSDSAQVAVGSLDDPDSVCIDDHVWTEAQILWFDVNDQLPRYRQSSTAVPTKANQ